MSTEDSFQNLNSLNHGFTKIDLPDSHIYYLEEFVGPEHRQIFERLKNELNWEQPDITLFGKTHKIPRLQAWYGDPNAEYQYSGHLMPPNNWHPELQRLRTQLKRLGLPKFNSVLANLYRNGQDGMGFHSDDEPELGLTPVIASITFGDFRKFVFKHKHDRQIKHEMILSPGSLLIMAGTTQSYYQHGLPKSKKAFGPRLNLTYRVINTPS